MALEKDDEKPYEFLWLLRSQHSFFLRYQEHVKAARARLALGGPMMPVGQPKTAGPRR